MEITHLRYFKKTAELEHITKAAQELHVAQPSLSRTISMLEDELKVKLFNRKGKSIELNEYGIIVLNHTNRILKELEAIHREIDDARGWCAALRKNTAISVCTSCRRTW